MRPPELLQQAELLQSTIIDENGEVQWEIRLELQHLLEHALLADLDYGISRHVEQTLWNFCFKNCIDVYQNKLHRRRKEEDIAKLQLFLDSCIGHFTQLLDRICREYNFQLDSYKSDAVLGILDGHFEKRKRANGASLNYIAQYCFIHLGDIARYQKNITESENFYTHAWKICPDNGHALNQLAILETSRGNHLSALSLYTRSLYVRNPFALAAGNVDKFCDTVETNEETDSKSCLSIFFRVFSSIHHCRRLDDAEINSRTFAELAAAAYDGGEIDSADLEHMLIVILGEMWKIISANDDPSSVLKAASSYCPETTVEDSTLLGVDELKCVRILLNLFRSLTTAATRSSTESSNYTTLPVVKLACDFMHVHPELLTVPCLDHGHAKQENYYSVVRLLSSISSLLNQLQSSQVFETKKDSLRPDAPLHEDFRLRGFLPLDKSHSTLNFDTRSKSISNNDIYLNTRINRLVDFGIFVAQRLNNSDVFSTTPSNEPTDDIQIWKFDARPPSCPPPTTSVAAPSEIVAIEPAPKLNPVVKRQTKVVALITILEREKAASEMREKKSESKESKPASGKTVRIKSPEPVQESPGVPSATSTATASEAAMADQSRRSHDMAPRFQAARLKQALTGEGKQQQSDLSMVPSPFGAWPLRPPGGFRPIQPPILIPPRPNFGDRMESGQFHRTPGVRPPGPPPFPLPIGFPAPPPGFPPMPPPWSTAPPGPWDQHQQQPPGPSLYLGRNEDPYSRNWESQQRALGESGWGTDWSTATGARATSMSPCFDFNSRLTESHFGSGQHSTALAPGGTFGQIVNTGQQENAESSTAYGPGAIGQRPSQQDGQFSLFGSDSPWEFASGRLLSQSGKE